MRVLFANNIRGYYGGVEQVVESYARGLVQRGHECFLSYGEDGRTPELFGNSFSRTYACSQFGLERQGQTFADIVRAVVPDVVFVHKLKRLPPGVEESIDYRKVLMVHDHDLWCPKGTGYFTFNRKNCHLSAGLPCYLDGAFLERREGTGFPLKLRRLSEQFREMRRNYQFDKILVLSEYLRHQLIINGFPPDRLCIHNPVVDIGRPLPSPIPEAPRILFVGSLVRGKGVDLLLEALAKLACPFSLDIVGSGKSEGELRDLASKLRLNDRVNFVGWVPHKILPRYYHEARVVAVPSCWPEPFGLTGQEAMHFARPVVAFDVGGISDWCENGVTGFTVPEQDVTAFANALERLLSDFDLAESMGKNGLQKVEADFSFTDNLDKVERYLRGS